jgi:dihydropteroate synthase
MRYHEAADFLFDLRRYPPRPGLDATAALLGSLGDPHGEVPVVQVAGSNGKGSTARMVESTLREAGLDVGLYTSPHLADVRERIRVNGRKIRKGALSEFVSEIADYVPEAAGEDLAPTFFEALTALAYWEFARQGADVAVVEVGIGGRYDATSVADPVAAAVTAVTLEHTDVLGDTIEEIARDKAAVAPADRPLVTGADGDALAAIRGRADVLTVGGEGADVTAAYGGREGREAAVSLSGSGWELDARIPVPGRHQARNAGVAAALARQVGEELGCTGAVAAALPRGLRKATWPGRFEVFDTEPLTVLDGAHNPGATAAVADTLSEYEYDDLHLVVGALTDKDHAGMAAALPESERVTVCRPDTPRAETTAVLEAAFGSAGADVRRVESVEDALAAALDDADPDDAVLVTGSLYTVAEARERWARRATPVGEEGKAAALRRAGVEDPDSGGHAGHTLEVRLRPEQARRVASAVRGAGGAAAVSPLARHGERVGTALSGSGAELERAFDELAGDPDLAGVVADLRSALEPVENSHLREDGTAVMGILNVTPDSFHDGGEYDDREAALERAAAMVEAGADIVDVGGESTRPGAEPVPAEEEIERVVPVVEELAGGDALVSVDTRKSAVARAAMEAGADVLNDVSGLADPEMARVAAEYGAVLVVMHSIDAPVVPEKTVAYDDPVGDVIDELREPVLEAVKAGVPREDIVVDPGVGFGKTADESFELVARTGEFAALGAPVLVGHSHKSMFGAVESYPDEGGYATAALSALAAEHGADVVRVHDVAENVTAVRVAEATRGDRNRAQGERSSR